MAPSSSFHPNIYEFISHREGNSKEKRKVKTFHRFLQASKLPSTFQEHCLNTEHHDKIFVTYWLNPHQAIIGTKCNRLYIIHVDTGKKIDIPLMGIKESIVKIEEDGTRLPSSPSSSSLSRSSSSRPQPPRSSSEMIESSSSTSMLSRRDGSGLHLSRQQSLHSPSSSSSHRMTSNSHYLSMTYRNAILMEDTMLELQENDTKIVNHAGIHSISVNPSGTWMATGAMESCHIGMYQLPSFRPVSIGLGHTDWLFATEWLSDTILVSGSRDCSLAMWKMLVDDDKTEENIDNESLHVLRPKLRCIKHQGKVRDLKYNRKTKVGIRSIIVYDDPNRLTF
jgi:hypothetical protein